MDNLILLGLVDVFRKAFLRIGTVYDIGLDTGASEGVVAETPLLVLSLERVMRQRDH